MESEKDGVDYGEGKDMVQLKIYQNNVDAVTFITLLHKTLNEKASRRTVTRE